MLDPLPPMVYATLMALLGVAFWSVGFVLAWYFLLRGGRDDEGAEEEAGEATDREVIRVPGEDDTG